jgi:hypothetical protein
MAKNIVKFKDLSTPLKWGVGYSIVSVVVTIGYIILLIIAAL